MKHWTDEFVERDARRLRELEFLRKRGLSTIADDREAFEIKRTLAKREFERQERERTP